MTVWRDALLGQRNGFAKDVTGGAAASEDTWVTTLADSGTGSLRAALEASGPRWIRFAVTGDINLTTAILAKPDKTLDGRGVNVTLKGKGIYHDGATVGTTANLIFAYFNLDELTVSDSDGIRVENGGDLVWIHHISATNVPDGIIDIVESDGNVTRATVDWCSFGPNPGEFAYDNSNVDGKIALLGRTQDEADPGKIQVTWHHNDALNCVQRQPTCWASHVHAYNNRARFWGNADGSGSVAMEVRNNGKLLLQNNIFEPYNDGDAWWQAAYGGAATVTTADKEAAKNVSGLAFASSGLTLRNSATVPSDFGTMFTVPYAYFLDDPAGTLEADLAASAGNVQATAGALPNRTVRVIPEPRVVAA